MEIHEELLQLLACPHCRGDLEPSGGRPEGLICPACSLLFPIRDGIPVMLPEEAIPLEKLRNADEE
jgi:uncharacterized protein YbaR (Trm112 family)